MEPKWTLTGPTLILKVSKLPLETVNGNLGPVNGTLGALKKQQFAVIIGILLFF